MDKFVLTVPRYKQEDNSPKIRISQEAYTVLASMCAKTGWPMSRIASKAIFFAAENLAVEEETGGEE